jgi:hypothetical protein
MQSSFLAITHHHFTTDPVDDSPTRSQGEISEKFRSGGFCQNEADSRDRESLANIEVEICETFFLSFSSSFLEKNNNLLFDHFHFFFLKKKKKKILINFLYGRRSGNLRDFR